jgi:hypothetical protein
MYTHIHTFSAGGQCEQSHCIERERPAVRTRVAYSCACSVVCGVVCSAVFSTCVRVRESE